MADANKKQTSLTLDGEVLESAQALGVDVSMIAEAAIGDAVATARRAKWRAENAAALRAQSDWHLRNRHPLADIIMTPGGFLWAI